MPFKNGVKLSVIIIWPEYLFRKVLLQFKEAVKFINKISLKHTFQIFLKSINLAQFFS